MTYAILSDIHANKWSMFSKTNADGVNSRLRITLDEMIRAANELLKHGGTDLIIAGDIFHVRGSIDPEVLNPVQETIAQIIDMGITIHAIPGNHDLASQNTSELSSAIQTLSQTFSMEGGVKIYNEPTHVSIGADEDILFVPWIAKVDDLLETIERSVFSGAMDKVTLVIHAGIDGVMPNMPDHGMNPAVLQKFGFKRVFAGHYHNRKEVAPNIWSIGATTHQTWSDVGSKAGFIIVDQDDNVREFDTHAPKFVDLSGLPEDEMELLADGNYARLRGASLTQQEAEELKKFFIKSGALGVSIQTPKAVVSQRTASPSTGKAMSLDQSVHAFVDAAKDIPAHLNRIRLKALCDEVLLDARQVYEETT